MNRLVWDPRDMEHEVLLERYKTLRFAYRAQEADRTRLRALLTDAPCTCPRRLDDREHFSWCFRLKAEKALREG